MTPSLRPFNKGIFWICCVMALACGRQTESLVRRTVEPARLIAAQEIAKKTFDNEAFPGMAVMVMSEGQVIMSEAYGYADVENAKEIDPYVTLFRIGSISKPVTAAGLALLYEQGKIDLDLPIQTYVAEFPEQTEGVTIRRLAGHLAGIRHYKGFEFLSQKHYPTVRSGLGIFIQDSLIHEPGSQYAYSSYGWNLISAAMETAAEEEFLSYMQTQVFDRIGLNEMRAELHEDRSPDNVQYYIKQNGENAIAPSVDNSYKWAGGGFIASAHDVLLFAQAHLEGKMMSEATFEEWTNSQQDTSGHQTGYGIGWRTAEDKKGRHWIGHSGGSVGGTSMMLVYPAEELIVVTLVNQSQAKTSDLAFRIANQFLSSAVNTH